MLDVLWVMCAAYKSVVLSGVQPSGGLTIGNYIGAIQQWVNMQYEYRCMYCIVDLHAITIYNDPNRLYQMSLDTLALYLACGVNPDNSTIFLQSHVPEHSQLSWLLNCYTYFGELYRMVQFKEKLKANREKINIGLFTYPILMASDILLYQTNLVPVGEDQRQHVELARVIAKRFNRIYGSIFVIPEILVSTFGSKIMSLLDPMKKMSKSDCNVNNVIRLLDDIDVIKKKINGAVTDSNNPPVIQYDPINKPGISNLLVILSSFSKYSVEYLEHIFKKKTYLQLKSEVIRSMLPVLIQLQNRYYIERSNENKLCRILYDGSKNARIQANLMLKKIYKVLGFVSIDNKF